MFHFSKGSFHWSTLGILYEFVNLHVGFYLLFIYDPLVVIYECAKFCAGGYFIYYHLFNRLILLEDLMAAYLTNYRCWLKLV